jgi:hypothetical protein
MIDPALIDEGYTKLAAASSSPWGIDPHAHLEEGCRCLSCYAHPTVAQTTNMLECQDVPVPDGHPRCEQLGYTWADAELIEYMRNNIADLLDAARKLERVREALSNHPRCEKHPDDDVVKCGWKQAVAGVQWALEEGDDQRSRAV